MFRLNPKFIAIALVWAATWFVALPAHAERRMVAPGTLAATLERVEDGDRLVLQAGVHRGGVTIEAAVTLRGENGAVIDGGGQGNAIRVRAPGVEIRNLEIRDWGQDLTAMDAGIFVEPTASGVRIRDNRLRGPGFGIWVDAAPDATIARNRILGDAGLRSQDRGNGIHLFNVTGARVIGNVVSGTRDGIYIDSSNGNLLRGNTLADLRYGIHYMYSYDNRVEENLTRNTRTGYALMQSKRLTVWGNRSVNDENYGILMNFITRSTLSGNSVTGVRQGRSPGGGGTIAGAEGKALFIYNSQFNTLRGNRFEDSDIGIHITAGSEDNQVHGNAFVGNREQVKYVATRCQEWSRDGRGNYWSDYLGWDLDDDGVGDTRHEPNDAIDKLLWRYPAVRLLMNSPAVVMLRWVQRQFPVLRPEGVRDSHPLMRPPRAAQRTTT